MGNWAALIGVIDQFFNFFWSFKIWGIPILPIMAAIVVLGMIMERFFLGAREGD